MFWRLGVDDDNLPVAATSWLNDVWMRPVAALIMTGRASA
jgi:hypothetical protein